MSFEFCGQGEGYCDLARGHEGAHEPIWVYCRKLEGCYGEEGHSGPCKNYEMRATDYAKKLLKNAKFNKALLAACRSGHCIPASIPGTVANPEIDAFEQCRAALLQASKDIKRALELLEWPAPPESANEIIRYSLSARCDVCGKRYCTSDFCDGSR